MSELTGLGADVEWPDRDRADSVTRLLGPAHGRLAELAGWLAGATEGRPLMRRARIVVIGNHRAAEDAAEFAHVAEFAHAADLAGAGVRHLETGSDTSLLAGVAAADAEVDAGADAFVVAVPDCDVVALTVISALTGTEPVKVLPRGAVLPVDEWIARAEAVRDLRRRVVTRAGDPAALLEALECPALELAIGLLLRAAARRTPTVLDGLGALAAASIAFAVQPRAARWCQAADGSRSAGQAVALAHLDLQPILDLGVESGDGTSGALALIILRAAAQLVPASD